MKNIFLLRYLAIENSRLTIFLFAVVTLFLLYGNYFTPQGSVIPKDAIQNPDNPIRKMDDYVMSKKAEGFRPDEPIILTRKFSRFPIRSRQDLQIVWDKTQEFQKIFGKDRVLSLANIPNFKDKNGELISDFYINEKVLKNSNFDVESWKKEISGNSSVFGKFVSHDFKMAYIYYYVDDNAEQMSLMWKVKSFLEEKTFGWIDQFLETDIHPKDDSLGIVSWIAGRWVIHQALLLNILMIISGGIVFILPGFQRALGSWSQAIVSIIIFFLSIIWTRGLLGAFFVFGFDTSERVFTLFSYANCIVQGVSFSLHKFIAYNEARELGLSSLEAWERTKRIDRLITRLVIISVGGFLTLWWSFGVLPIADMAIASSIGILCLWLFSRYLLPAMCMWLEAKKDAIEKIGRMVGFVFKPVIWFFKPLFWLVVKIEAGLGFVFVSIPLKGIVWINSAMSVKTLAAASIILIISLTGWAFYEIVWPNHKLMIRSRPLEFIPGTLPHKTSQELNQPGRLGFDGLNFLVEPKWTDTEGLYDPKFVTMVDKMSQGIKSFPRELGAREVYTIVENLGRISRESFNKPIPETKVEVGYGFMNIENKLSPVILNVFYYHNGVRLVVTNSADDSNNMARLREEVIKYAEENFPELRVSAFGRVQAYPEVDREIREGKPWNILGDQVLIVLVFVVWLWLTWRRARRENINAIRPIWGAVIMSLPMWFATMALALIMVYARISLGIDTAVISAMAINATSDFSFYMIKAFMDALGEEDSVAVAMIRALQDHGRAIVEDSFLNARCFLPLWCFSTFIPIQRIGMMMCVMMYLCLIGTLIIIPPLLVLAVKEKKQKKIYLEIKVSSVCRMIE